MSFYLFIIVFFVSQLPVLSSELRFLTADSLPKTKDLKIVGKKNNEENKKEENKNTEDLSIEEGDEGEEEEKINPTQFYKLIAIYLIGNEPRALIKNLITPDDPPKEYQVGDYIDEEFTLSISKITLNPTTRVELIDQNGLGYLIKPASADVKAQSGKGTGTTSSKSYSSKFNLSKSKSKQKKPTSDSGTQTSLTETKAQDTSKKEQSGSSAESQGSVSEQTTSTLPSTATQQKQDTITTGTSSTQTTQTKAPAQAQAQESKGVVPAPSEPATTADGRPADPFTAQ